MQPQDSLYRDWITCIVYITLTPRLLKPHTPQPYQAMREWLYQDVSVVYLCEYRNKLFLVTSPPLWVTRLHHYRQTSGARVSGKNHLSSHIILEVQGTPWQNDNFKTMIMIGLSYICNHLWLLTCLILFSMYIYLLLMQLKPMYCNHYIKFVILPWNTLQQGRRSDNYEEAELGEDILKVHLTIKV